jgi:hypothetical protein
VRGTSTSALGNGAMGMVCIGLLTAKKVNAIRCSSPVSVDTTLFSGSNSGGGSFGNIVMRKQVRREGRKMNEFYSKSINATNSDAPNGKHLQLVNGELIFNDFPFKLHKDKSQITSFRHYEIEHLVDLLIFEVSKRFSGIEETCKKESVLYNLIKTHRKKGKSTVDILIDAAYQRKLPGIFDHYETTIAKK